MRYVDLPQSYYTAYASGLANAYWQDTALMSHLDDNRLDGKAGGAGRLSVAIRQGPMGIRQRDLRWSC